MQFSILSDTTVCEFSSKVCYWQAKLSNHKLNDKTKSTCWIFILHNLIHLYSYSIQEHHIHIMVCVTVSQLDRTLVITQTCCFFFLSLKKEVLGQKGSYFVHSMAKVMISSSFRSQQPHRSTCSRGSLLAINDISPAPDTHTQPRKLNIRIFLHWAPTE